MNLSLGVMGRTIGTVANGGRSLNQGGYVGGPGKGEDVPYLHWNLVAPGCDLG